MNRRAFIAAAFSGLAAAALGMPTLVEGPVVIRDTSWPRRISITWADGFPRERDDEVDASYLFGSMGGLNFRQVGERMPAAAEVV